MKQSDNNTQVLHFDLYGRREDKYEFLKNNSISTINWNELNPEEPYYFFVPKNFDNANEYENGFKVDELFKMNGTGVQTDRDNLFIDDDVYKLKQKIKILLSNNFNVEFKTIYNITDSSGFKITSKIKNRTYDDIYIKNYSYKPFDIKKIYYDENLISRAGYKVNKNAINSNYIFLATSKNRQLSLSYFFISKTITDRHFLDSAADSMSIFPLYLYPDTSKQQSMGQTTTPAPPKEGNKSEYRKPNLNMEIVNKIAEGLGLTFTPEKDVSTSLNVTNVFAPIDILDYIYAVLHSPNYREKYKEFLKIDFPRVPFPKDKDTFWKLVKLGGEIRQIHLLESPVVEKYITQYPIDGNNEVTKPRFEKATTPAPPEEGNKTKGNKSLQDMQLTNSLPMEGCPKDGVVGAVYINDSQYFANVPDVAWNFYIGGYQPAQKWLKDRKGRTLEFDDILHYQKIIVALTETDRIMKVIDGIEIE
jgi:predicted helicase